MKSPTTQSDRALSPAQIKPAALVGTSGLAVASRVAKRLEETAKRVEDVSVERRPKIAAEALWALKNAPKGRRLADLPHSPGNEADAGAVLVSLFNDVVGCFTAGISPGEPDVRVDARLRDMRPSLDQLRARFHPERDALMRAVQFLIIIAVAVMPMAGEEG
jgi:hypothetical protein